MWRNVERCGEDDPEKKSNNKIVRKMKMQHFPRDVIITILSANDVGFICESVGTSYIQGSS